MTYLRMSALLWVYIAFLTSCKDPINPVFENVENITVGKIQVAGATTVSALIHFYNPNSFGLHLKSMSCELYLDSAYIGVFTNKSAVQIPSRAKFAIPVEGSVQTSKLLAFSGKAIFQQPSAVLVNGVARVGRVGVYKSIPFSYNDTLLLKW